MYLYTDVVAYRDIVNSEGLERVTLWPCPEVDDVSGHKCVLIDIFNMHSNKSADNHNLKNCGRKHRGKLVV